MSGEPPSLSGPMPSSFDDQDLINEKPMQKVKRKLKEEPLIPLGIALTSLAFINAYRALRRGDSKQANRMFRARVAAQGFTVIAMLAGSMYYNKDREKSKELRQLKEQHDNEEKRLKWIRELEARDEEEKAFRAHLAKRRQQAAAPAAAEPVSEDTTPDSSQATGGLLSKLGLWPRGEKKAAAENAEAGDADEKVEKKKNPKSSLGDLGEIIASKKKEEADSKPKE